MKRDFIEVIARTGNVSEALRVVGRSKVHAYRLRQEDEAPPGRGRL